MALPTCGIVRVMRVALWRSRHSSWLVTSSGHWLCLLLCLPRGGSSLNLQGDLELS